ncbi:MAG: outer membrane lipoprotein carrier protein LolA [bacterium]
MRKLNLLLFGCFVILWMACGKEATVDEVVTMMADASGGAEALAAVQDQVSTWDFKMIMMPPAAKEGKEAMAGEMPEVMPMKITYKRPNKLRMDVLGPEGTPVHISCFDGTSGWASQMGHVQNMTEAEIQENESMAATWIDGFIHYKELGFTLAKLPTETVDGEKYMVLQSTDKYGNVSNHYINPKTHYIERTTGEMLNMEGAKEQMTMTFKDYKMMDGIAVAGVVAQYNSAGEMIWEATLKECKNNTGVEDAVFMRPEITAK